MSMSDQSAKILKFHSILSKLKWTKAELETLPKELTKNMVHVALEIVDENKNESLFNAILEGNGKFRKAMLLKHISYTKAIWHWNCSNVEKIVIDEIELYIQVTRASEKVYFVSMPNC